MPDEMRAKGGDVSALKTQERSIPYRITVSARYAETLKNVHKNAGEAILSAPPASFTALLFRV
jgi:hypothetical protein